MTSHLTRRTVLFRRVTDECVLQWRRGMQLKWRISSSHSCRQQNFLSWYEKLQLEVLCLPPSLPPSFHFVPWIYNLFNVASKSCVATWIPTFHFFSPSRILYCALKSFFPRKVRHTNSSLRFVKYVSLFIWRCSGSDICPHAFKMLHTGRRQWSICHLHRCLLCLDLYICKHKSLYLRSL